MAYFLKEIFPDAYFFLVDIPESLLFSALYLTIAHAKFTHCIYEGNKRDISDRRFDYYFIPNYLFHDLVESNLKIDLAINTLSFAEMSEAQVLDYAQGLKHMLGKQGIFFEQNHEVPASPTGCNCKKILRRNFLGQSIKSTDLITIDKITLGTPTLWANVKIAIILPVMLKPFQKKEWQFCLINKKIKFLMNPKTWGWWVLDIARIILRRIVKPSYYRRIADWILKQYEALRDSNNINSQ